jgi:hypothetical protein
MLYLLLIIFFFKPSLLDTNIGFSSLTIGPQNPSSALLPKPKKIEQTSTVCDILPS